MDNKPTILSQLDQLESIVPGPDWNERLFQQINYRNKGKGMNKPPFILLSSVILLLAFNLIFLVRSEHSGTMQSRTEELKSVASEFLINTSSSKF